MLKSQTDSATTSSIDRISMQENSKLRPHRSVHDAWQLDEGNKFVLHSSEITLPLSTVPSKRRGMIKSKSAWELDLSRSFSTAHTSSLPTNTNFEECSKKKRKKKKKSKLSRRTKSMEDLPMSSQVEGSHISKNSKSSKTRKKRIDTIKRMQDTVEMFDEFEQLLHVSQHGDFSISDISEVSGIPKMQRQDIPPSLEIAMKISRRNLFNDEDLDECDESKSFHDCNSSNSNVPMQQQEEPTSKPERRGSKIIINELFENSLNMDDLEPTNDALAPPKDEKTSDKICFKPTRLTRAGSDPEKTPLFFFETNRGASVDRKITLSVIFLRAYAVVLNEGAEEIERVESLVEGTARANLAYSTAMRSVIENSLGHKAAEFEVGDVSSRSYGSTVSTLSCKSFQDPLTSLFDSQSIIADQFSENANHALTSGLQELSNMKKETKDRSQYIEDMGDALMSKLESVEEDVKKSWQLYNAAAVAASSSPRTSRDESENSLNIPSDDLWLLEMRYHVAVAYQASLWRKVAAELSAIFLAGRQGEQERRGRLQALLLDFVSKQKRLMPTCSSTHPQILQELLERNGDKEVEIDIVNTLKSHVDRFQRWENDCLVDFSLSLEDQEKEAFASLETLECPLSSKLVTVCRFVDRKVRRPLGGIKWQKMMAVSTMDRFFHLFAVPEAVDKDDLQDAFLEFLPEAQLPSLAGEAKSVSKSADELLQITPTESFFLPDCKVLVEDEGCMSGLMKICKEQRETTPAISLTARNFFQKSAKQEVELRADYFHDRNEWRDFRDSVFCDDFADQQYENIAAVSVK